MPDYAMCRTKNCPNKDKCARYLMVPNEYRQTCFSPEPSKDCKHFWDKDKNPPPFALKKPEDVEESDDPSTST